MLSFSRLPVQANCSTHPALRVTSVTEVAIAAGGSDRAAGRSAATRVVSDLLGVAPDRVELVSAPGGAPQARVDGEPAPVALSLSHRHGRALAVAAAGVVRVGCDLERIEPRHRALARRLGLADGAGDEDVTLAWAAREALAKALREPVGLDTLVEVSAAREAGAAGWAALDVSRGDDQPWRGWWRLDEGFVAVVVSDPAAPPPANGTAPG